MEGNERVYVYWGDTRILNFSGSARGTPKILTFKLEEIFQNKF